MKQMGIPKLRPALVKALGDAKIYRPVARPVGALFIDCNAIIHAAVGEGRVDAVTEDRYPLLIANSIAALKSVVDYYKPKKLVYLAFDGPIPMAKIQDQRDRRYLSASTREKGAYSSDLITPGTKFMVQLDEEIRKSVAHTNNTYGVEKLVYSSHLVPGEGEHKIMQYIRQHKNEVETYVGGTVIYGNDSDLVLLGLCAQMTRIWVCKDSVDLLDASKPQLLIKPRSRYDSELSIDLLREALDVAIGEGREDEFIFACSLLGNDFLPRSAVMSDITEGMRAIVAFLRSGGTVINDNCLELFRTLASEETLTQPGSLLSLLYDKSQNPDETAYKSRIFNAVSREAPENMDDAFHFHWYTKFLLYHEFNERTLPTIPRACLEYIRGLNWVYDYYTQGQNSVTWLWYYPFHHAPLFADLAVTVEAVLDGRILGGEGLLTDTEPVKGELPFTCLHQLVSVMPIQSVGELPEVLYPYYGISSPIAFFMPLTVMVNDEMIELPYQERAIIPKVDYYTIMRTLGERSLPTSVISKYANTVDVPRSDPVRRAPERRVPTTETESGGLPTRGGRGGERGARGGGRGAERGGRGGAPLPDIDYSRYSRDTPTPPSRGGYGQARGRGSDTRGPATRGRGRS